VSSNRCGRAAGEIPLCFIAQPLGQALGGSVVAKVDHPNGFADWKGVDKLRRYVAKIGGCSTARLE
jgi:hypothetical protein